MAEGAGELVTLAAGGVTLVFRPAIGQIVTFTVSDGERRVSPLHTAPWVGTGETLPRGEAPHMAWLGGDFFCAPFAADAEGSGIHGWPANSAWDIKGRDEATLTARLRKTVQGATLDKRLTLREGHPFVYQSHRFNGGAGRMSVANHANVSVPGGGVISTSPKRSWETPATALEPDPQRGRSCLEYPAIASDPARFPARSGPVDLTRYPWGHRHDDFVAGIETEDSPLGWTAVVRPDTEDLFLSLRNPSQLPMTMFWHSNGGRDYAPWSSRHFACLGVEEGIAAHMLGVTPEADLPGRGALDLGGETDVRHVIGAIDWSGGGKVENVRLDGNALTVADGAGHERSLPFDRAFLFPDAGET